jgi:hypothetical protein
MPVPAHNRCVNLLLPHSVCGVFSCHIIYKAWIQVYCHIEYIYLLTIFNFQLQELRYPYHRGLSYTNTTLGGESPLSRHIDEHRREHDTVRQRSTKHHHHPSRADRGRRLFRGNITAVRNSSGNRYTYQTHLRRAILPRRYHYSRHSHITQQENQGAVFINRGRLRGSLRCYTRGVTDETTRSYLNLTVPDKYS